MTKLSRVVSRVQRNFRRRRANETQAANEAEAARLRADVAATARLRQMRQSREAALRSVEALPAQDVDAFLRRRESESAIKIQALWKGWRVRRKWQDSTLRKFMEREAAARVIQRRWRTWLKNSRVRKQTQRGKRTDPALATESEKRRRMAAEVEKRKEKRLKEIRDRALKPGPTPVTHEELLDLDQRVQEMLGIKNASKQKFDRSRQRCEVRGALWAITVKNTD